MLKDYSECTVKTLKPDNSKIARAIGTRSKYWQEGRTISVSFMGGTQPQIDLVKQGISQLMGFINLRFVYVVDHGDIRISFVEGGGSWSYLGTDAKYVPKSSPTMNFGWLHPSTPTDIGTVKHELTHMIGANHEHQFPNGITFILEEIKKDLQHWTDQDIINNIIRQSDPSKVDTTEDLDLNSIMLYAFPARWNKEGISTKVNTDWSLEDRKFWSNIYPKKDKYKEALQRVYADKNIVDLLKSTHTAVANILGASYEGREQEVIKNIKHEISKA